MPAGHGANFAIVSKAKPCVPGVAMKERYVMDSIDLLRTQLSDLSLKVNTLSKKLGEEIETRTQLQNSVEMRLAKIGSESDGLASPGNPIKLEPIS